MATSSRSITPRPDRSDVEDYEARLRRRGRLAGLFAVAFVLIGAAVLIVPALIWTGSAGWIDPRPHAFDRPLLDQIARCLLSVAGGWSALALVGVALRRCLCRRA